MFQLATKYNEQNAVLKKFTKFLDALVRSRFLSQLPLFDANWKKIHEEY